MGVMKKIFNGFFLALLLTSCGSQTTVADKSVSVFANKIPKTCKHMGVVSAENLVRDNAIKGLKQMTYDLKGNFVKIVDEEERGVMTVMKGDAYFCE